MAINYEKWRRKINFWSWRNNDEDQRSIALKNIEIKARNAKKLSKVLYGQCLITGFDTKTSIIATEQREFREFW